MTLEQLLSPWPELEMVGDGRVPVQGVTADSRLAKPGMIFVAVKGHSGDGHRFLDQAVEQGCEVLVHQDELARWLAPDKASGLKCTIQVPTTRPWPALLARELRLRPDRDLITTAVTGTNGKTTVAFLMREMLNRLAGPCGLLGTIRYDDGQDSIPAPLTTPGGPEFYHWLSRMVHQRCRSVAMELSSHALDQQRVAGLSLDVAVMTNIGRDHLDYHRNTASYVAAKGRILELLAPGKFLVSNAADPWLTSMDKGDVPTLFFDPRPGRPTDPRVDLQLRKVTLGLKGSRLELLFRQEEYLLDSPLVGRFNVENLMAAFTAGLALGFTGPEVCQALSGVRQVPGRLERIALPGGALAVVDYAHTHDALEAVLQACDELSPGRLLLVFGCGGDRDKGKRPLMGQVSARFADAVWITSDNPRSEDPATICREVEQGYRSVAAPRCAQVKVVVDRRQAIVAALAEARAEDIVVVAGKGHEDYQLVGDQVLALDDRDIVRDWIKGRESGR